MRARVRANLVEPVLKGRRVLHLVRARVRVRARIRVRVRARARVRVRVRVRGRVRVVVRPPWGEAGPTRWVGGTWAGVKAGEPRLAGACARGWSGVNGEG
jgi:hypothetical protein